MKISYLYKVIQDPDDSMGGYTSFIYLYAGGNKCLPVFKATATVSHYIKHKKESPHITLASFFKMHYIDPQPMDADYNEDMQFPFKTAPDALCRNIPLFVSTLPEIELNVPVINYQRRPVLNDDFATVLLIQKVLQLQFARRVNFANRRSRYYYNLH